MRLSSTQNNYSRLTLRMTDKSLSSLFWEFSIEEIFFTMPYFTILAAAFTLQIIFRYDYKIQLLIHISEFSMYVVVHVLGNKYRNYHVYGMLFLFVNRCLIIYSRLYFKSQAREIDYDLELRRAYDVLV